MANDNGFETEVGSTFLDFGMDLNDVPDLRTLPDGTECQVQLTGIEVRNRKNGPGQFLYCNFDVVGEADVKGIGQTYMLPTPADDEKRKRNRLAAIRDLYRAFGIPTSGQVELGVYIGNIAWAILGEEDGGEYGMQNRIKRFTAQAK